MVQVFLESLTLAASVMASVFAWLLAALGLVACIAALVCLLAVAFDAATSVLVLWWKLTKHKPRGKLERILMREHDGI